MDADERVLSWAAQNVRGHLTSPPIGSHEGIRIDHYRHCPDLQVEVVDDAWQEWFSELTYGGWKIRVRVTCPHGEITTSRGVTPLTPVERTLDGPDLDEILDELDAQDGQPASDS